MKLANEIPIDLVIHYLDKTTDGGLSIVINGVRWKLQYMGPANYTANKVAEATKYEICDDLRAIRL